MKVAIVGVGLIGGSLGMALRAQGLAQQVIGVGRNAETLETARRLGAVDEFATDLATGVRDADLVVLATPILQILADLERLPRLIPSHAIVTDVGSTKGEIAREGDRYFPNGLFVPGHPMTGSERSGVEAARANLFQEAVWAFTPSRTTDPDALDRMLDIAQAVGSRTVTLAPDAHDQAVAVTSHLPHVLAYALASLADEQTARNPHIYDLAAGSFASMTRVAASSPELWRDIALTNREALLKSVHAYRVALTKAEAALEHGDGDTLLALFRAGYAAKRKSDDNKA